MKVCVMLVRLRLMSPMTAACGTVSVATAPAGLLSGIGTGGPEYVCVVGAPVLA